MVAAASGTRLTARAILSAVRSWSSRPSSGAYVRRGSKPSRWCSHVRFAPCDQRLRRPVDLPVRAVHHPKPGVEIEVIPTIPQLCGMGGVDHEMHGDQLVGAQSLPVAQCREHREVKRVDKDEHAMSRILHQLGAIGAERLEGSRTRPGTRG